MKSVPTFITRLSYPRIFSHIYIFFANTGYTSEPLLRTYPLYIVENKVHALSRRCRDHLAPVQTRPAFFPSFSRINNSLMYTRRVKLTVYYPPGDGDKFSEAAVRAFRGKFVRYSHNESRYIYGRTTYLSRLPIAFCLELNFAIFTRTIYVKLSTSHTFVYSSLNASLFIT